jgi:hypothetical protein
MSQTTKRAKSARPAKLAREVRSPLADALERAGKLPGAVNRPLPLDVKLAREVEAVALPVLAFGVFAPNCDGIDFYAVLDDIAARAGQSPSNADDTPRIDAAYYLGIAIGMRLAGGGR